MQNHIYKFGEELRGQREGGHIGVELTGALSDLLMLYWDRKFLNKLKEINIQVKGYKRFKDDTDIMLRPSNAKNPEKKMPFLDMNEWVEKVKWENEKTKY